MDLSKIEVVAAIEELIASDDFKIKITKKIIKFCNKLPFTTNFKIYNRMIVEQEVTGYTQETGIISINIGKAERETSSVGELYIERAGQHKGSKLFCDEIKLTIG